MKPLIKILSVLLLGLVFSSCSKAGAFNHYVLIEAENPDEKDFVVECIWSSSKFSLHGGNRVMKRKLLIADAGELVDCGFSMWQLIETKNRFGVRVRHPMGGGGAGIEHIEQRTDAEGVTREVYVVRQVTHRKQVDRLTAQYSGRELFFNLRPYASGILINILDYYSKYYQEASGQSVNVAEMRRRYSDRLLESLEYAASMPVVKEFEGRLESRIFDDPTAAIERMWESLGGVEAPKP